MSNGRRWPRSARPGRRPSLRVGVVDASYDSMPLILHEVQQQYPDLEIHQVEAGVPEQFQRLVDGRLDVGHRAGLAGPAGGGVRVVPAGSARGAGRRGPRLRAQADVPVATLAAEPLLLSEEERAPEFNQFVIELCRSVGFIPTLYRGTVDSILASVDLVAEQRCVMCAPPRACPPPRGSCGGPWWLPCRAIRGRCCGAQATPRSMSASLSTPPAHCPAAGLAGAAATG